MWRECLYGLIQHLFFGQRQAVQERLHRGLAKAVLAAVRACLIVLLQPSIQVGLEFVKGVVDFLAKGDLVELLQYGLVEAFADAVRLGSAGLGPGVVDVLDGQVELVFMVLAGPTVLGATIGQHA